MVRDGFHELVIEIHSFSTCEAHVAFEEGVLQAHHAKPDGTMAHIRTLGGLSGVEINIDHVVKRADGDMNCLSKHFMV